MAIVMGIAARPEQGLSKALLRCGVLEPCLRLAFNWNVIGEAPLIMNHIQLRLAPSSSSSSSSSSSLNCAVPLHCFPLADSLSLYHLSPPPPVRRMSVMCSGAMPRNKAPYWVQSVWVNVCLGHKPQETGKKKKKECRRWREGDKGRGD